MVQLGVGPYVIHNLGPAALGCVYPVETSTSLYNLYLTIDGSMPRVHYIKHHFSYTLADAKKKKKKKKRCNVSCDSQTLRSPSEPGRQHQHAPQPPFHVARSYATSNNHWALPTDSLGTQHMGDDVTCMTGSKTVTCSGILS